MGCQAKRTAGNESERGGRSRQPTDVETVARHGYRLIAPLTLSAHTRQALWLEVSWLSLLHKGLASCSSRRTARSTSPAARVS